MTARSMPYRNGVIRGMKTRVTPMGNDIAEGTAGSANTWSFTIFDIQLQPIGSLKEFQPHWITYWCIIVDFAPYHRKPSRAEPSPHGRCKNQTSPNSWMEASRWAVSTIPGEPCQSLRQH